MKRKADTSSPTVIAMDVGIVHQSFSKKFEGSRNHVIKEPVVLPSSMETMCIMDDIEPPSKPGVVREVHLITRMGEIEKLAAKACMIANDNKSCVLSLRDSYVETQSGGSLTPKQLQTEFKNIVFAEMDGRLKSTSSTNATHGRESREFKLYKVLGRCKSAGYLHLLAFADSQLNTPIKKPSNTDYSEAHMQKYELFAGPLMEKLCVFPWRGSDA
jgi:hypothetical protein